MISQLGQLACPQFIAGNCDCATLSFATRLCGSLQTHPDVAGLYHTVFCQVVKAQTRQESNDSNTNETNKSESSEPSETVQHVHHAVHTKLDEASTMMKCTTCGYPGLKDPHGCMHTLCAKNSRIVRLLPEL
jgi:hypothetical protein